MEEEPREAPLHPQWICTLHRESSPGLHPAHNHSSCALVRTPLNNPPFLRNIQRVKQLKGTFKVP